MRQNKKSRRKKGFDLPVEELQKLFSDLKIKMKDFSLSLQTYSQRGERASMSYCFGKVCLSRCLFIDFFFFAAHHFNHSLVLHPGSISHWIL